MLTKLTGLTVARAGSEFAGQELLFHMRKSAERLLSEFSYLHFQSQAHLAALRLAAIQDTCRLHMSRLFAKLHTLHQRVNLACSSHLVRLLLLFFSF